MNRVRFEPAAAGARVDTVWFFCPGCATHHAVTVRRDPGTKGPIWSWNRSLDRPTFQPSVRVLGSRDGKPVTTCHLYVTDGRVRYLPDSAHALAGQTIDLPEVA